MLLSVEGRRRGLELFLAAAAGRLSSRRTGGAQATADMVVLAAHAAAAGASAVAVIAPPYYPLDERAQLAHFTGGRARVRPVLPYVYEFERTSGCAVPPAVIARSPRRSPTSPA